MLKWGFKDMSLIWEVIWEGGSRTEERKIPAKGRQCVNRYCVHLELSPIAGQEPWAVSPPTAIPCCWGLFTGVNPLAVLTCPVSAQRPSLWLAQTTEIYFLTVLEAENLWSRCQQDRFQVKISSWLTDSCFFPSLCHHIAFPLCMWISGVSSSSYKDTAVLG